MVEYIREVSGYVGIWLDIVGTWVDVSDYQAKADVGQVKFNAYQFVFTGLFIGSNRRCLKSIPAEVSPLWVATRAAHSFQFDSIGVVAGHVAVSGYGSVERYLMGVRGFIGYAGYQAAGRW